MNKPILFFAIYLSILELIYFGPNMFLTLNVNSKGEQKMKNWEVYKKQGNWKIHKRFETREEARERVRIMKAEGHTVKVGKRA